MTKTPQFPPDLLEAANNNRLIVFLGAGFSCAVGLPSWNSVRNDLIKNFRLKEGYSEDIRSEYQRLDFYECFESIRSHDETTYKEIIDRSIVLHDGLRIESCKKWFDVIRSWQPIAIITTNVDDLMMNYSGYRSDQFRYKTECSPQELRSYKAFLLHGNKDNSVWTVDHRNTLYNDDFFKNFLWNAFGSFSILFIGTSFREKWIEFARLSPYMRNNRRKPSHYALVPSNEQDITPTYLRDFFGIETIQYENSDGTYQYFGPTIESWKFNKQNISADDISEAAQRVQS